MYSVKYKLFEFRDRILKHLCRYSSNGTVYPSGEKADIENRLVTSLNIHLARLWQEFSAGDRKCRISFFAPPVIADVGNIKVGTGDTEVRTLCGNRIGFFMTVCGKGRISVTTSSGTRIYNADTEKGERTIIRGNAENDGVTECVFSFTAESFLEVCDFTVYEGVDTEHSELLYGKAVYAAYLPSECSKIIAVYDDSKTGTRKIAYGVLEKERVILIPSSENSVCNVEYVCYPPKFDESVGDESEIYLSPLMADALGYMCAADLCPVNDPELYSRLTYKYREILENLYPRRRNSRVVNKFYGLVRKRGVFPLGIGGGN